jgi:hypothetical protein
LIEQLEQAGPFRSGRLRAEVCFSRLHHCLHKTSGRVTFEGHPKRWVRNKIGCNLFWCI